MINKLIRHFSAISIYLSLSACTGTQEVGYDADNFTVNSPASAITVDNSTTIANDPTPISEDCTEAKVHCVDDTAGANQEFSTIQQAVYAALPGDTVLVHDGNYDGFAIGRDSNGSYINGTSSQRITIKAKGDSAVINTPFKDNSSLGNVRSRACGIAIVFGGDYFTIDGFDIQLPTLSHIANAGNTPYSPSSIEQIGGTDGYHNAGICTDGHVAVSNHVDGLQIKNNTIANGGDWGIIVSHCNNCLFENNEIYGTYRSLGLDKNGHGIYLANAGSDDSVIRGNTIHHNDGHGIHSNGDYSRGGDGIITNLLVENNKIHENGLNYADSNGGVGLNMDGVQDSLIRNNLIYGNYDNGIKAYGVDGVDGPKNIRIINNTITTISSSWTYPIYIQDTNYSNNLGGHTIFNNVLLGPSGQSILVDSSNLDFTSDHNIIGNEFYLDGAALSYNEWLGATAQDSNSIISTVSELFIDPANGNYHLKANSVSENAGIALLDGENAPTSDLDGTAFVTRDIGAYAQ